MLNNVTLVGRIVKDPEVKVIGEGTSVCNFTLAVNRPYKDSTGEQAVDFINCQAWKHSAEFMGSFVKKGHRLGVIGSINTRTYDKDGETRYVTEVNASQVQSFETKSETSNDQFKLSSEEIRKNWDKEWEAKSAGLDATARNSLKQTLAKKYQPMIDRAEAKEDKPY
jgi:single-strand DNA-binding protein